jgi:hypothetical protein
MADEPRYPLSWKQKRTPTRKQKRSANWQRLHIGHRFPGTDWELTQGPYKRVRRDRVKSWVIVRCLHCNKEYDRRLDHLVQQRSRCCLHCAPGVYQRERDGDRG